MQARRFWCFFIYGTEPNLKILIKGERYDEFNMLIMTRTRYIAFFEFLYRFLYFLPLSSSSLFCQVTMASKISLYYVVIKNPLSISFAVYNNIYLVEYLIGMAKSIRLRTQVSQYNDDKKVMIDINMKDMIYSIIFQDNFGFKNSNVDKPLEADFLVFSSINLNSTTLQYLITLRH